MPEIVNFVLPLERRWAGEARCASHLDLMFPDPEDKVGRAAARRICSGCPVRESCLTEALERGERFGVWGGLTEDERRGLDRQGRTVKPVTLQLKPNVCPDQISTDASIGDGVFRRPVVG